MVWYNPLSRLSERSRSPVEALEHKDNPSWVALKDSLYTTADLSNFSHNLSPTPFPICLSALTTHGYFDPPRREDSPR